MKSLFVLVAVLLIGGTIFYQPSTAFQQEEVIPLPSFEKIKGVCWEARDSIGEIHIQSLEAYHINWISQTPFGWQRGHNSPEIAFHSNRGLWGERDIGLTHTATLARQKGIKTLLKPHIWLTRANGKWRSDIEMDNTADWEEWFQQYEQFFDKLFRRFYREINIS